MSNGTVGVRSERAGTLETIRWRLMLGFGGVMVGLVVASAIGVAALRTMHLAVAHELVALQSASQVGNGLVTSVFDEIRSAEQYLSAPSDDGSVLMRLYRSMKIEPLSALTMTPTSKAFQSRFPSPAKSLHLARSF